MVLPRVHPGNNSPLLRVNLNTTKLGWTEAICGPAQRQAIAHQLHHANCACPGLKEFCFLRCHSFSLFFAPPSRGIPSLRRPCSPPYQAAALSSLRSRAGSLPSLLLA